MKFILTGRLFKDQAHLVNVTEDSSPPFIDHVDPLLANFILCFGKRKEAPRIGFWEPDDELHSFVAVTHQLPITSEPLWVLTDRAVSAGVSAALLPIMGSAYW